MKVTSKFLVFLNLSVISYISLPFGIAKALPIPNPDTTTYVTCYFKKGGNRLWKWGLKPDNGWFELSGSWNKTQDTRINYFATKTSQKEIKNSCEQSKAYYGYGDYNVDGMYAANSSLGSNYPIYNGDGEVKP